VSALRLVLKAPRLSIPGREHDRGGLDLVVEPGRRTVLLGRSGAGKSLLARLALGRLPGPPVRSAGRVEIHGGGGVAEVDLSAWPAGAQIPQLQALRGRHVSFVPQGGRENLVPGWTVRDHLKHLLPDLDRQLGAVVEGMEALGVDGGEANLSAVATELSEGMIRRILVALAMARGAEILVIDEPTTGLDPTSRAAFSTLLHERILDSGAGVLLVTHDLALCQRLGGEALLVDDGAIVARTEDLPTAGGLFTPFLDAAAEA
jgi:ABC-type glutathione transport system ATPase component